MSLLPTSLSPSSAADWQQCPLMWRYKRIDRLASAGTLATVRGTLVHAVLERLFDLPAGQRTGEAAVALLGPEWARLLDEDEDAKALTFTDDAEQLEWKRDCVRALAVYFTLEDPNRLEPHSREQQVRTTLPSGLRLNGYIDRVDVAPSGATRIVDYKTGKKPPDRFQSKAIDQLRFYALAIWRETGKVPARLQLLYLRPGASGAVTYDPREQDLVATEEKLLALWKKVEESYEARQFVPKPSRLCDWCDFRAMCPAQGGELLPWPSPRVESDDTPGN